MANWPTPPTRTVSFLGEWGKNIAKDKTFVRNPAPMNVQIMSKRTYQSWWFWWFLLLIAFTRPRIYSVFFAIFPLKLHPPDLSFGIGILHDAGNNFRVVIFYALEKIHSRSGNVLFCSFRVRQTFTTLVIFPKIGNLLFKRRHWQIFWQIQADFSSTHQGLFFIYFSVSDVRDGLVSHSIPNFTHIKQSSELYFTYFKDHRHRTCETTLI